MKILVTGGCGFIGSHFIRRILMEAEDDWEIVNLDALTYAGNLENLVDVEKDPRLKFVKGSITDAALVDRILKDDVDGIINFAAESHVDRSIQGAVEFVRTNIEGTAVLLEAARKHGVVRFLQVSTDEVYGSLPPDGFFRETTPLHPNNPYAATKAAADMLVLSYVHTHGLDAVITRSSNNYGAHQYPEKFIPLFVSNALEGKQCPVYGDGMQIRDWLHVSDNCRAIWEVFKEGTAEVYNIGGGNERPNIQVAKAILDILGKPHSLLKRVKDRPGHDRRYAIDCTKIGLDLGWSPETSFDEGLVETVEWYVKNPEWIARVKSGAYREYYEKQYSRGA